MVSEDLSMPEASDFGCDVFLAFWQVSLAAEHIRNEKVKVLRSMKKLSLDDVVIGQYRGRSGGGVEKPGYLDDDTVPEGRSVSLLACLLPTIE